MKLSEYYCNYAMAQQQKLKGPNKIRSFDWWENVVLKHFNDDEWLENFRVSKATFLYICRHLETELRPKPNPISRQELVVSVEKRLQCLFITWQVAASIE